MTLKKIKTNYSKDQEKHVHRQSYKGHKTKNHFLSEIEAKEADAEIKKSISPIGVDEGRREVD
jgi:hypothetical protein